MANLAIWTAPESYSSANLADASAMASRADGYYAICQVSAADVVIDNETDKYLNMAVEIALGSATWTVAGFIELYLLPAVDTAPTYPSGSTTYLPTTNALWGAVQISTDTSAASRVCPPIIRPIPPLKFKMLWRTKAGVTLAASGSKMSFRRFNMNLNG